MNLFILGVTGSIGLQTLDLVRKDREKFNVVAVTCNKSLSKLREIIIEFSPLYVSIGKSEDLKPLKAEFPKVVFGYGIEGLCHAATYGDLGNDLVINAVVGSIGLRPTIDAIEKGRNVALANKETLVIGGEIIKPMLEKYSVLLLPIDSEHSAIMQCMNGEDRDSVTNIIITASGGSFRDKTREELEGVTVKEALAHPNWSMGAKITIDSATMMNKGLEIIEAHHLFDIAYENIQTVLHKESVIHSMVEYNDTTVIAHLGNPDMRVPINYAINYPERIEYQGEKLDLIKLKSLNFEELSMERYPLLRLAIEAGKAGGLAPTVLNAANESAVALFLDGKITFLEIESIVEECLNTFENELEIDLNKVLKTDKEVKQYVINKYS